MNIQSSHKFTRSGDTASGCIEGVNLEEYQVGVIGGRQLQETPQKGSSICVWCAVVATCLVLVVLFAVVITIPIVLICRQQRQRKYISWKTSSIEKGSNVHQAILPRTEGAVTAYRAGHQYVPGTVSEPAYAETAHLLQSALSSPPPVHRTEYGDDSNFKNSQDEQYAMVALSSSSSQPNLDDMHKTTMDYASVDHRHNDKEGKDELPGDSVGAENQPYVDGLTSSAAHPDTRPGQQTSSTLSPDNSDMIEHKFGDFSDCDKAVNGNGQNSQDQQPDMEALICSNPQTENIPDDLHKRATYPVNDHGHNGKGTNFSHCDSKDHCGIIQESDDEGSDPQRDTPPTDSNPPSIPGFADEPSKSGAAGELAESIETLPAVLGPSLHPPLASAQTKANEHSDPTTINHPKRSPSDSDVEAGTTTVKEVECTVEGMNGEVLHVVPDNDFEPQTPFVQQQDSTLDETKQESTSTLQKKLPEKWTSVSMPHSCDGLSDSPVSGVEVIRKQKGASTCSQPELENELQVGNDTNGSEEEWVATPTCNQAIEDIGKEVTSSPINDGLLQSKSRQHVQSTVKSFAETDSQSPAAVVSKECSDSQDTGELALPKKMRKLSSHSEEKQLPVAYTITTVLDEKGGGKEQTGIDTKKKPKSELATITMKQ